MRTRSRQNPGAAWKSAAALVIALSLAAPSQAGPPVAPHIPPPPGDTPAAARRQEAPLPEGVPTTRETVFLPTVNEVKLGREVAAEAEKEYVVITEGPEYERLQRVAAAITAVAQDPDIVATYLKRYNLPKPDDHAKRIPFEFSFKLVKRKDGRREVNAFSLAGGPVFVTLDLMRYTQSDNELAGVLGHEVTHIIFHHVVQMVRKSARAQRSMLLGTLAGLLLGVGGLGAGATGAIYGVQLYTIAKVTGYGQDLEREADHVGLDIVMKTAYSPVGMLTFMKKLARDDSLRNDDFGIYQSHPYSSERVELIEKHLGELKVDYNSAAQRRASNSLLVEVTAEAVGGKPGAVIRLNGRPLVQMADPDDYPTAYDRAVECAKDLRAVFLEQNIRIGDLRLSGDGTALVTRGRKILEVLPADARAVGATAAQLAAEALKVIESELWKEKLDGVF